MEPVVTSYASPREFLAATSSALLQREWQNALALGVLQQYLTDNPPQRLVKIRARANPSSVLAACSPDPATATTASPAPEEEQDGKFVLLATSVTSNSNPVVFAVQTPSHHVMGVYSALAPSEIPHLSSHLQALLKHMLSTTGMPDSVAGDDALSRPFAELAAASQSPCIHTSISMSLTGAAVTASTLSPPPPPSSPAAAFPGVIRRIALPDDEQHVQTCVDMAVGVFAELAVLAKSRPGESTLDRDALEKTVRERIANGNCWVCFLPPLDDDDDELQPAALVMLGRPTAHGKSIVGVYTRPEFRRRGVAERLVREAAGRNLARKEDGGDGLEYVALFCEEGSSAARIYRRIGFGRRQGDAFTKVDYRLRREE